MKVLSFKAKWSKLKQTFTDDDLEMFYDVIDLEETCGRVLTCSNRDFNPRFMSHWFPVCRCHWNVIFPLYILNNRKLDGDYAIITNEKHSAIINKITGVVYDPTYDANGSSLETTVQQFSEGYEVTNIIAHSTRIGFETVKGILEFVKERDPEQANVGFSFLQAAVAEAQVALELSKSKVPKEP